MGCNTSSPSKDILKNTTEKSKKVASEVIQNGKEKVQNSLNDTINDVTALDFDKAKQDLQQVGVGLETIIQEGMNELLGNSDGEKNETEMVKVDAKDDDLNPSSVTLDENGSTTPFLDDENKSTEENSNNMNTPIPSLDTVIENETEDIKIEDEKANESSTPIAADI